MAETRTLARSTGQECHILGAGFGPSNLALAVAVAEHNEGQSGREPLLAEFHEKQDRFGWHRGMLIDGATMQVSFLKDLVTMRNPTSRFGFLSYLRAKDRLADFINHKVLFPSRMEFHHYLEWVSAEFESSVRYGSVVVDVLPVMRGGEVTHLDVVTECPGETASQVVRGTRNLVIAVGLEPVLPPGLATSDRVWHSAHLMDKVTKVPTDAPVRFVVLGAGQSAAEVAEYLHRRFVRADVHVIFSRYGYCPADDSPFANRIFDPDAVDTFFGAPSPVKEMILQYHRNTNYSAVDVTLIEELFRRSYQEAVVGDRRLHVTSMSRLVDLRSTENGIDVLVEYLPTGDTAWLESDFLVTATGYRPNDPLGLLGELADLCELNCDGQLLLGRNYRVVTADNVKCGIYLQGGTEHSHGLSSSLLSNTAVRAGEIVDAIAEDLLVDRQTGVSTPRPA